MGEEEENRNEYQISGCGCCQQFKRAEEISELDGTSNFKKKIEIYGLKMLFKKSEKVPLTQCFFKYLF